MTAAARSNRRPSVALVLGAGGSVGHAFHLGVLNALEHELGWDSRQAMVIVGTSAGSIVGAGLRAGIAASDLYAYTSGGTPSPTARAQLARGAAAISRAQPDSGEAHRLRPRVASVERLVRALRQPWHASAGSLLSAVLPEGTRTTAYLGAPYDEYFPDGWPSRPLWIPAVRLDRGDRVVFGRDTTTATVGQAVQASCAVPAYFAPVDIAGERFVDGGVHSTTNAELVAELEPDLVIVSAPMSGTNATPDVTARTAIRQFARRQLLAEVGQLTAAGIETVVFEPTGADFDVMAGDTMDPAKAPAVAAGARQSVLAAIRQPELADRLAPLSGS